MKTLALAAVLAFAGCQSSADVDGWSEKDGVTLRVATPERLTGSYVDANGQGLVFDTARTEDNLYIHLATKTGQVLVHAETTETSYVFHYMDNRLTLEVSKAWIEQVRAAAPDAQTDDETQMHWTGDKAVLDEMLAVPELKLLPTLSRTLGEMGYTGNTYQASLPLHKIARQSADALGIDVQPIKTPESENSLCTAYPNQGDSCYGMCGPGCSCWSWVCGDCCYHYGCARHDSWCRQGQWYYCYNISAVIALFGC